MPAFLSERFGWHEKRPPPVCLSDAERDYRGLEQTAKQKTPPPGGRPRLPRKGASGLENMTRLAFERVVDWQPRPHNDEQPSPGWCKSHLSLELKESRLW